MKHRYLRGASCIVALLGLAYPAWGQETSVREGDLADLSLEQLSNIVVSSVSGRAEPLARALGSVYVITSDDIRRAGATTLPEALRLAPNLQVARTGSTGYAITARGFNGTFANKLLILIDGRSVYTPTFSGVFWDAQEVMVEDIDRIEVISGPGGVLWGANAVNGVINIQTKPAAETRKGVIAAGAGTNEARVAARYGSDAGHYRVYATASHLDETSLPDGTDNQDETVRVQAGFRSDWTSGPNVFTVQGDAYDAEDDQQPSPQELRGVNLLGRWNRDLGGGNLRVQGYYDRTTRQQQELDTVDFELGHALDARGKHTVLWGAGLRQTRDRIENSATDFAFIPANKTLTSWNVYLQDVIALRDDLDLTVGARADRNSYTGVEFLPSARIGWRFTEDDLVWAAWSRAARTPSRFDRELFLPGAPPFLLAGGPDFASEISHVFELGYRGQPATRLSWAATVYYADLERQRSIAPGADGAVVTNDREGHSEGVEAWGAYRVTDRWRLWAGYSYLSRTLDVRSGAVDLQPESSIGSDPKQWGKFRSAFDLGKSVELDVLLRYYDELTNIAVPSYTAVDVRLGWYVSKRVELSLLAQNLLDSEHVEWSPGAEFERAAFVKALIRF